jgi:hypothetical protein
LAATAPRPGAVEPLPSSLGRILWNNIQLWDRFLSNQRNVNDTTYVGSDGVGRPLDQAARQGVIQDLTSRIKSYLEAHLGCRSRDDFYAQTMLRMLQSPGSSFQRLLAIDYATRFGGPPQRKACTYELHIVHSEIKISGTGSDDKGTTTFTVHVDPVQLQPVMRGSDLSLRGAGPVTYEKIEYYFSFCPPPLDFQPLPAPVVWVTDLRAIFDDNDRITNFALQGVVPDPITANFGGASVTTELDDENHCHIVKHTAGAGDEHPDTWGIGFPAFHNRLLHTDQWSIDGDESFVATSMVTGQQQNVPQGSMTESTNMVLTVNQQDN